VEREEVKDPNELDLPTVARRTVPPWGSRSPAWPHSGEAEDRFDGKSEDTGWASRYDRPKDRLDGSSVALFRVTDIAVLRASLSRAGTHIINERVPLHWADLMYFADPEGGLLGAEQGYHPGTYAPEKFVLPEVLEIERRRLEAAAANR
jgi:hypothetical protein